MLPTTIRTDQRACSFTKLMDRRITPDNGDIDSPSQTRLPRRSTPNVDVRSPSQGGRPHLPHQSTPDVDDHPSSQRDLPHLPRRSTPDVDTHSPSQVGHSNLPHRSTPDNINARSPSLTEHRDLPHQSTPDVDIYSQSHAGHSGSGLPRQITPEDVDTRWPFRAGYPRLLRPSVVSIPIEDEAEKPISDADIDRLQSRITEILDSYDLPWCTSLTPLPEVVYRRQKFGTFGLPRVLIHCNYDKDTSYSKKWTEAVVEIYTETQSVVKGDCEVGVELVDKAIMNSQICSLPTPMSQELSANWEIGHNYCEQILHLFEAPHDMFQVMVPIGRCVRRTGLFYDRDPTCEWTAVVFFDALNAEDVLWDSLEERIRSILPSHIDIEIRQRSGPVFYSPPSFLDKYVEGRIPSPEEYARPPRPGCDIGVQGGRSAGTMGGYVATEDKNGKRTTYGITNAHVALQSYEKCVFSASADSGIRIVSPSEMSRTEAKSELLKQIPRLENQIPIHKEIIDAWEEEDPDLVQRRKKVLESVESELASAKSTLELIEQEPYVGSVHNASIGDTVYSTASSQCEIMMDLALIKMHCLGAERPEKIYLKEYNLKEFKPPLILPDAVCDTWETDSLGVSHDGDGKNHIKVVGKLSRTGVYTFGIVNDFRAVAFPFTENGVENKKTHYMWVVSNPASYSTQKPFSRGGDSGSFVIAAADWEYCDYDNRVAMPSPQAPLKTRYKSTQPFVVGLLFGGTGDEELSCFIPFDAVKSEIESLTGEEMVWPRKRSDCVRDDVA